MRIPYYQRCSSVAVVLLLCCSLTLAQDLALPNHRGAFAVPAFNEVIEFDIFDEDELIATVTVRGGTFATVTANGSYLGISPQVLDGGAASFVVYEIERMPDGREKISEREIIEFANFDSEIVIRFTEYSFIVKHINDFETYPKMMKSCDRCCIYCNGRQVCACSVATSCGSCCCSDCCEGPRSE